MKAFVHRGTFSAMTTGLSSLVEHSESHILGLHRGEHYRETTFSHIGRDPFGRSPQQDQHHVHGDET